VKLSFDHGLKPGNTVNNNGLREIFKCGLQGGMRRSHATNSLVIISDPTKGIYEDRWLGDIFHYTGMGLRGDQSLDFAQNRTLAQSHSSGVGVFLLEVFERGEYTFGGQIELAGEPYQEDQVDADDNLRKVWVFPLRLIGEADYVPVSETLLIKKQKMKERQARRLSDEELAKRARYSQGSAGLRQVSSKTFERNPYVAELASGGIG
jgi:5-methylcytosine-specific restriction protein A